MKTFLYKVLKEFRAEFILLWVLLISIFYFYYQFKYGDVIYIFKKIIE